MNFELVRLSDFSGHKTTIYSVILQGEEDTLFDQFIIENEKNHPREVQNIVMRIKAMGEDTGARFNYFKLNEGVPGDGVCALYDEPDSNLRLYCICYGSCAVIIGGGGFKSKQIRALQEDEKLKDENYMLREISKIISQALIDKDIRWSGDGMELIGDLIFTQDDE